MDPRLLKYAEQNAPRYTSYPTAPHFSGAVDGRVFADWLGELPADASVSLYLHQPYCQQMCWYCGCHAFAARRDEPVADYVTALMREIELAGAAAAAKRVREIHWGGGTPNLLSSARFEVITACLRQAFDLNAVERHAVEIDPRLLTREQAEMFASCGVNRVSLGVQDFDARVQAAIGREQPFETVRDAVSKLHAVGLTALSFDLMYGLPHQSVESVRETARRAASLAPARFSVFGYAHVPWFKKRQRLLDVTALPGAEARLELAEAIAASLGAEGYVAIGYDHYARPDDAIAIAAQSGRLERNFQGFVEARCDALIGLGPSAISTLPQGYAQNEPEVGAWRAAVTSGAFATKRGHACSAEDCVRRDLIMKLLCSFEVDLRDFGSVALHVDDIRMLASLERDGLVRVVNSRLSIPDAARPFARLVAQVFDAYREQGEARHSRAV